jgi:uncharacterized protein
MHALNVVFHIDEIKKWALVLGNVKNFIKDIGKTSYSIEIVVNAAAVMVFAVENEAMEVLLQEMETLNGQSVKISVCKNALKANGLAEERLPGFVDIVSAGVTRLVLLQNEGYAYIKP